MHCDQVEDHLSKCNKCAGHILEQEPMRIRLIGAGDVSRGSLNSSPYDLTRLDFNSNLLLTWEDTEILDDGGQSDVSEGYSSTPTFEAQDGQIADWDSQENERGAKLPLDPTKKALLEGITVKILCLYRLQIDLFHHDLDIQPDFPEAEESAISVSKVLLARRTADLDDATAIVELVNNHAIPNWPSRAIANFILVNLTLIHRGMTNEELESSEADPAQYLTVLVNLWFSVVAESVRDILQGLCTQPLRPDTPIEPITLKKAALLLSALDLADTVTMSDVLACIGTGEFTIPVEQMALAIQQHIRDLAAVSTPLNATVTSGQVTLYGDRDPIYMIRKLVWGAYEGNYGNDEVF